MNIPKHIFNRIAQGRGGCLFEPAGSFGIPTWYCGRSHKMAAIACVTSYKMTVAAYFQSRSEDACAVVVAAAKVTFLKICTTSRKPACGEKSIWPRPLSRNTRWAPGEAYYGTPRHHIGHPWHKACKQTLEVVVLVSLDYKKAATLHGTAFEY